MSSNKFKKNKIPNIMKSGYRKNGVIVFLSCLLVFLIILAAGAHVILYETHKKLDVKYLSALVDYNEDEESVDDEVYEDKLTKKIENDSISEYEKGYPADKLGAERDAYNCWKFNKENVREISGVKSYLIVGIDGYHREEDEYEYECADLLTLMTINDNNHEVVVTNLSPECYVYIPSVGVKRLADAYHFGGIELTVKTVEENYGIYINRYLLTDYADYIDMIDSVGGVDVSIDKEQVSDINALIDDLSVRNRISDELHTTHLEEKTGKVHLDGAQTLSYLRMYVENDYLRGEQFQLMTQNVMQKVAEMSWLENVIKIFPQFTTDVGYEEFISLLVELPEYLKYDVLYRMLPADNVVAPFKEKYEDGQNGVTKKTVLLNSHEKTMKTVDRMLTTYAEGGRAEDTKQRIFNPVKLFLIVYMAVCVLIVLLIIYLIFIHKRRIVYIDVNTGKKYKSKKAYRKNEIAHPYHYAKVVPGKINGLFADSEMMAEFEQEVKMPMNRLYVYCDVKDSIKDNVSEE